ncbi:hypothetical protein BH11ACT8_BH11ACT8_08520 [soil metagenome]
MTPGEIERKVRQLDNDVQEIYVLLHGISATQSRHSNRLDSIDGRLDSIDGRLDSIGGRLDGIDGQLGGLTSSMAEVLRRLPER